MLDSLRKHQPHSATRKTISDIIEVCIFSSSALFYPALALPGPILHGEKGFGGGANGSVAVSCEYLVFRSVGLSSRVVRREESGRPASGSGD